MGTKTQWEELRDRNQQLLETRGELVTLFQRKVAGEEKNVTLANFAENMVSALPLNLMYYADPSLQSAILEPNYAIKAEQLSTYDPSVNNQHVSPSDATFILDYSRRRQPIKPFEISRQAASPLVNYYFYIGNDTKFFNLSLSLLTGLTSSNALWEYSKGGGTWSALPIRAEGTDIQAVLVQESGRIMFDSSGMNNWAKNTVNNEEKYWIRLRSNTATTGVAQAIMIYTQNIIRSSLLWASTDAPVYHPDISTINVTKDGAPMTQVFDIDELTYSPDSFFVLRREAISNECPITEMAEEGDLSASVNSCDVDPMDFLDIIGTLDYAETVQLREKAILYQKLKRAPVQGQYEPVAILFTRNMETTGHSFIANFINQCPCVSEGRGQGAKDSCLVCYGTSFVGGYDRYVNPARTDGKLWMSFPQGPFDMSLGEPGLLPSLELTTVRAGYEPKLCVRDIIVRYQYSGEEEYRYLIKTRTDSKGQNGIVIHQELTTDILPRTYIEYQIPAPTLPFDPTFEEVVASTRMRCPPTIPTPTTCETRRLRPGLQPRTPARTRKSE